MNWQAHYIPYAETGYFSTIVRDYLAGNKNLDSFYRHKPDWNGLQQALAAKAQTPVQRETLVQVLTEQYCNLPAAEAVNNNIQRLLSPQTFSICTAHQPNIFTGHLYVIYKILHAIQLAAACAEKFPGYQFVPVYYMGSEDADLDELGQIMLNGEKLVWETSQTGAVGRMLLDAATQKMLNRIAGELEVQPFGKELLQLLRRCYTTGKTMQQASLELFHELFGEYGLVVLIADHPQLKKIMQPVFADELFNRRSSALVAATSQELEKHYRVQAHAREINLFYLNENRRERIEPDGDGFAVKNTAIRFTRQELETELENHPEHFSPNVILRGLYQETILPNIAFIGGGGELAYWLQFNTLFAHYGVPLPVLVLRNSFLFINEKWGKLKERLNLSFEELFLPEPELQKQYVKKYAEHPVQLTEELAAARSFYGQLRETAARTDKTLSDHVAALEKKATHRLTELEKKMLRAEKRKQGEAMEQIKQLKTALFPGSGLQERSENFMPGYAEYGKTFIELVRRFSSPIEAQFTVIHTA